MKLISPLSLLIHRHIIKNADMTAYLMLIKLPLRMTLEKQRTSSTRMLQLALSEYRCYCTFRHAPRPRATPAGSSVLTRRRRPPGHRHVASRTRVAGAGRTAHGWSCCAVALVGSSTRFEKSGSGRTHARGDHRSDDASMRPQAKQADGAEREDFCL